MRASTLTVEKRSVPMGAGLWFIRWFVMQERLDGDRTPLGSFVLREEAELFMASREKQWESKDE